MRIIKVVKLIVVALVVGVMIAQPTYAAEPFGKQSGPQTQIGNRGWCVPFTVPVAPAEGQERKWRVGVTYCQPFKWAKGQHQVDVLTHGSTYTRSYWDWPQSPSLYSYVDKTLAVGRAIINYDRIGNGKSTRPASSTEITMTTDAYVLNQLVLGAKLLGYHKINSISHSYGGGVALAHAAAYKNVSKVILTGYLHRPSNPAVSAGNYPANQDPKFASAGLDNGWLTSRPGVRGTSFHAPTSNPAVVAYDEVQKDITSLTGLLDFLGQRNAPAATNISNKIKVPVLVINGDHDNIFCHDPSTFDCANTATVTANEAPFYTAASRLKVVMVKDSGHNLTLHPTANDSFNAINKFIRE